ncbi:hypothetical protein BUALT_Bualt16G0118900 [Buddleja alternifolia]|uniref:Glycosyltransferase N-terminal domain-containing protein n=1 Tax=Buddleja alternifolia TaxID=168488 RepID=A0AAV6WLT4_9LAMI|nr:hypothetical protein BUALT_Bualt16G0118900 [Buddleja alternifolia]
MTANQQNNNIQNGTQKSSDVAVVMVPLPAQGHLNQLLHLSRLISAANIPIHYIAGATHLRQAKLRLHGWNLSAAFNFQFHELPTPDFHNPPPNPNSSIKFPSQIIPSFSATTHLRRPVFTFVNELSTKFKRVVVIFDSLMSYVVQDLDSIPNCESYCFRSVSAFTVYSFYWEIAGKPEIPNEVKILKNIPGPDGFFPPEFSDFRELQYGVTRIFSGDIYNSSREIEGLYLNLLEKEKSTGAEKAWALGPFNPVSKPESKILRDELVSSMKVEKVVRMLMDSQEGGEIRKRAKELGVVVRNSLMEGGSGCKEMESFIAHITR